MKILIIITGADIGGAQKHLIHLVQWFKNSDSQVEVITGEDGPLVDWLKEENIPVEIIPIPRKINWKGDWYAFRRLTRHIRQKQYDVVHCHSSKAGIIGRLAAFVCGIQKIIFTAHGFVFTDPTLSKKKKWFYLFLERVFGALSTDIITVSHFDYQAGIKIGLNSKKLHVIHNAIPKNDIIPIIEWEKKQEKLRIKKKKIVGFVGRFVSEKNVDMIIRIASLLKENSVDDVEFWLIGDGKLESQYQQRVEELGLKKLVLFWGNQSNILNWMDRMHLLIITSHKEGLPYVLLEALGRGLPVISTEVGGVRELLDPEYKLDIIVPVNDDRMMLEKIINLLQNHQKREQFGRVLLQKANECTVEEMCNKTERIYKN